MFPRSLKENRAPKERVSFKRYSSGLQKARNIPARAFVFDLRGWEQIWIEQRV